MDGSDPSKRQQNKGTGEFYSHQFLSSAFLIPGNPPTAWAGENVDVDHMCGGNTHLAYLLFRHFRRR